MLFNTTAGTYHMHESFEANDPTHFTRCMVCMGRFDVLSLGAANI